MNLLEQLGDIDIYLLDQLLKGRITLDMRILDAGCGAGRNLTYFMRNGYEIYAVDRSEEAIHAVRKLGERLAPNWSNEQARVEAIEKMSFTNESFDFVICNAVLHFAENQLHFQRMVNELWRVLKPGGLLFARLASSIGIETKVKHFGDLQYLLPDGSTRFLVDEAMLTRTTEALKGVLFEPLKTVNVAGQRCMSIWCVKK
jgi:2-polyprenyl-3-methyl-5-hydroxy-6-metoxy-1,4-benzoquinol methylase